MPQGKSYIFALQNKDFQFWKVVNGSVTINNQPYFLDYSPSGWEDISVQNIRNDRYWGIDRSVTLSLSYVNDGAQILKYIFTEKGTEESVYLCILEQQLEYTAGVGYGYWYKLRCRLEVDLTTYDHSGVSVKAATLEDSITKYLKSNEKTVYEFPMNDPQAINVKMDGISLHEGLNFQDVSNFDVSLEFDGENFFGPIAFVDKDGESTGVLYDSEELQNVSGASWEQKAASTASFIHNINPYPVVCRLQGKLQFQCTSMTSSPPYAIRFRFIKTNQLIGDQNLYSIYMTAGLIVGQFYTHDFDISITLQPGERIMREGIWFAGPGTDAKIAFTDNSKFRVTFLTRYQETYVKAFRPQYLFSQFIDKMTEGKFIGASSLYFSTYSTVVFTCGNALRGLTDAVMKMSFDDFFQFWDSFDSVGLNTIPKNSNVFFGRKQDLIDLGSVVDLPEPSNVSVTPATKFFYNELAIGYPELSNEIGALNGNEEFNTLYNYSMGTMKKPGKLDKVSKMAAGCYPIEHLRVSTVAKDTTDNKADNNNFLLHIFPDEFPASGVIPVHFILDRTRNASATGLIEATSVFNIGLSPHLNFKRNGPFLRSCGWKWDAKTLAYVSVDKNNKLTFTDPVYGPIVEKADENLGGLGERFFDAVLLNGTFPAPNNMVDLIDLLDANPLQIYRFPFYGSYYKGILMIGNVGLASHKEQTWQFLSLPENDLRKLEKYFG